MRVDNHLEIPLNILVVHVPSRIRTQAQPKLDQGPRIPPFAPILGHKGGHEIRPVQQGAAGPQLPVPLPPLGRPVDLRVRCLQPLDKRAGRRGGPAGQDAGLQGGEGAAADGDEGGAVGESGGDEGAFAGREHVHGGVGAHQGDVELGAGDEGVLSSQVSG